MRTQTRLLLLFSVLLIAGCGSVKNNPEINPVGEKEVDRNEICFGQMRWPTGDTFALSDRQAKRLKAIVWGTGIEDPFSQLPEGMTVSPAEDFSYFTIYGETFNFIPPAEPHNFRLSPVKQRQLDMFMAEEFGMTTRWSNPQQMGEQAGSSNGG
jgi:hypothetical protein